MVLNIYEKKKVVKTYKADTYELLWGTVTDVAKAVKLDELKTGSDKELMTVVFNLALRSMDTVSELMKDIFEGITDEELEKVQVTEIAQVLVDVVKYTFLQMRNFSSKN